MPFLASDHFNALTGSHLTDLPFPITNPPDVSSNTMCLEQKLGIRLKGIANVAALEFGRLLGRESELAPVPRLCAPPPQIPECVLGDDDTDDFLCAADCAYTNAVCASLTPGYVPYALPEYRWTSPTPIMRFRYQLHDQNTAILFDEDGTVLVSPASSNWTAPIVASNNISDINSIEPSITHCPATPFGGRKLPTVATVTSDRDDGPEVAPRPPTEVFDEITLPSLCTNVRIGRGKYRAAKEVELQRFQSSQASTRSSYMDSMCSFAGCSSSLTSEGESVGRSAFEERRELREQFADDSRPARRILKHFAIFWRNLNGG